MRHPEIPWNLNRTVAPTQPVVTVADLKAHARITIDTEDLLVEALGAAAEEAVADELSVSLLTQTWVLRLDYFPAWEIKLPRPPLASVTQVQYVDSDGVTQVLATTEYTVDAPPSGSAWRATPGRIHLAFDKTWPVTRDVPNAVIVTYVAGVTTPEGVPELIRAGIGQTFADLYEHRERSAEQVVRELAFYERLMGNHRCVAEFRYV